MSQRIYKIRKSFLVPLGVDVFLLCALFVISMLLQGSATERTVFAIFFVPSLSLFSESLLRRVTVDGGGIVLRKLLREKRISWEGIIHTVLAWTAAAFIVGIILIKMLPFMA